MNLLDIIIIIITIFFVVKGLFRGFIREVASLAGIILGIWLASEFQSRAAEVLIAYLPSTPFVRLIAFALIFAVVLIVCNLLGWGLTALMKKASFGWMDKALGTGLAVAKSVILIYLVIVLLTFFLPARTPLIAGSRLAPMVIASYQSMIRVISPERYQRLKKRLMEKKDEIGGASQNKNKGKGGSQKNEKK